MDTPKTSFFTQRHHFSKATQDAVAVSESRIGIYHTGRQNRVLMTFAKAITHAMSIQLIFSQVTEAPTGPELLDHFSIGALTRTLIDSSIMTLYMAEPSLSLAEWDLRRQVLFLHDLTNRRRFLTAIRKYSKEPEPAGDKEDYQRAMFRRVEVIKRRGKELALPDSRIEELTKGQLVFIDGLRGALREANLDVDQFDFIYAYLSNYIHTHPVSHMRADEHHISFESPSDFQFGFCSLCLEAGAQYLDAATERVRSFTGHEMRDPNGQLD